MSRDRWLFKSDDEMDAEEEVERAIRDHYATWKWPPKPEFDRQRFETECNLAKARIEDLYVAGEIAHITSLTDPRLQVIKGYFGAFAEGKMDATQVYERVKSYLNRMWVQDLGAALFGLEIAVSGFLAMCRPELAEAFGEAAAATVERLRLPGDDRPLLGSDEK